MFGWLRKSSKESSHSKKSKANSIRPNYADVDDRVTVKPLDQNFDAIEDEEITTRDRPHSVTAARPYFQAKQHLDQQQQKQTDAQAFTDDEDNYDEKEDKTHDADNNDNEESHSDSDHESSSSAAASSSSDDKKHAATELKSTEKEVNSTEKTKRTKLRTFKQKEMKESSKPFAARDTTEAPKQSKNERTEYKKDSDVSDTIAQSTAADTATQEPTIQSPHAYVQQDLLEDVTTDTPPKAIHNVTNSETVKANIDRLEHPGLRSTNSKTRRGFSKRLSRSKQLGSNQKLQRRRSSGRKTRSFTMNAIPNVKPETKPNIRIGITEANSIIETEQERTRKKGAKQKSPIGTPKTPKTPSVSSSMSGVLVVRIEEWLKRNNLWFDGSKKRGEKLLNALLESGIEDPQNDLALLSVHPDLTEIAQMAELNILQRRKFINAAHTKIDEYRNVNDREEDKAERKVHIVMSTEEQEALARMDSIIEQMKHTRALIKERISSIRDGGVECEAMIRNEFEILRKLLRQREEELIGAMMEKVQLKLSSFAVLDHDLRLSLEGCQTAKISAQKLLKSNKQPRVSRSKWRVLQGRKKAVMDLIEKSISAQIVHHSNSRINELIITRMGIRDMQATLPKPLIAQYSNDSNSIHHHQRHYDALNPYLLNIFTKNMHQIHLELSVAGFAFNYTERRKMHNALRKYGVICDVEESVRNELQNRLLINEETKQLRTAPYKVTRSKMILINPEDYMKKRKKQSKSNIKENNYATLQMSVELDENQCNEWRIIHNNYNENESETNNVLNAKRMKEIEIQIGMKRRLSDDEYYPYEEEKEERAAPDLCDDEFGWISLGWCDVTEIAIEKETDGAVVFAIPFALKKEFQQLMTQTFLASLELEIMQNEFNNEFNNERISKEELEQMVVEQLANDELFEFNSRNVDEFERKFIICLRMRCRDLIDINMSGDWSQLSRTHLIVSQSNFGRLSLIHFGLLRPMISVLAEEKAKLHSKYLNGFISIVGNESLQFIDPITTDRSCILSQNMPRDVDSCGLIIDFIRFKHPTLDSEISSSNAAINDAADDSTLSLLRTINNKKLSILRIGGANVDAQLQRVLTGRLDIYNIHCASWIQIGELQPFRENMAVTMFYGRVCVTGGNIEIETETENETETHFELVASDIVEEFSFSERKFKPLKHLNIARFGHCMCAFSEKPSKLFVYGGETHNGEWTNSIEIYDPPKRSWMQLESISKYARYGSSCCLWKTNDGADAIIIVGGQCESDESSKHCELFIYHTTTVTKTNKKSKKNNEKIKTCSYEMKAIHDLNLEHGIFPAVWCDADDNAIYVASQYVVVDNKNKHKSCIKYRVERLDDRSNKWRVLKSNQHQFNTNNSFQIIKNSNAWNANAIRKSCGLSLKIM